MKIRAFLLPALLSLTFLPGVRAEGEKPVVKAEKPATELEKVMAKIGKAWRQVRTASREGRLTPALAETVAGIRVNAEAAAKLTPALEAEQPEASRAKFQADYQAQMKKLVDTLAALEKSLKTFDTEGAAKLVGEVNDLMKAGHHDFKKPGEMH